MKIIEYVDFVRETDRLPKDELSSVTFGLYGEIGELLTAAKKKKWREPDAYTEFPRVIKKEAGDSFWYLCCLAGRLEINLATVFSHESSESRGSTSVWKDVDKPPLDLKTILQDTEDVAVLANLGKSAGDILDEENLTKRKQEKIANLFKNFFSLVHFYNINLIDALNENIKMSKSRFLKYKKSKLPDFDSNFPDFERLPEKFQIEFLKKSNEIQAMRWNGVFIGDSLSDNARILDGYRFHDVFHLSYAAMLHWSPVFRALIKHKRKSDPDIDASEDGGRAIAVEEGISAWIFNVAKENKFFEGYSTLTFDLLKHIKYAVKNLEVENCPLSLWEETILKGYEVFRELKKNDGGVVIGDRIKRTISYEKKFHKKIFNAIKSEANNHHIKTPNGNLLKTTPVYDTYWRFATERQRIFMKRINGEHPPWTNDKIMSKYRFTNAYRASDRVSQYLIKNVIYKGPQNAEDIFFRTLLFKIFNKIETWELFLNEFDEIRWKKFNIKKFSKILDLKIAKGDPIYSAAYVMPSPHFGQIKKYKNHFLLLKHMMKQGLPKKIEKSSSLKEVYNILYNCPSFGSFLAFQFAIDLNYSKIINFSEMDFVVAGPGARNGIRKCFVDGHKFSPEEIIRIVTEYSSKEFNRLDLNFQTLWNRKLQLVDCQNLFCEVDKYARIAHPDYLGETKRTRIKQKYVKNMEELPQWYPPKWDIKIPKKIHKLTPSSLEAFPSLFSWKEHPRC